MDSQQQPLQDLQHIKQMMERSSRFISLSGLSGIAAGICALIGAYFAGTKINCWVKGDCNLNELMQAESGSLLRYLIAVGALTFIAAFIFAFIFTYLRSKKNNTPIWGTASKRLFWNTLIPVAVGGLFLIRMMTLHEYMLIAPGCLIFYGLALVNGSKYTIGEIRYLGFAMIALGLVNLLYIGNGVYFWAVGFGGFHIIYGGLMWWKYERNQA